MASVTLNVATTFPVGTSVSAYPFDGHGDGLPSGSAVDTQTVPANGMATFQNLTLGGSYWAIGTVAGALRRLLFYVSVPPQVDNAALNLELNNHESAVTDVHGIPDTSLLADASDLAGKLDAALLGAANGVTPLDGSGHVDPAFLNIGGAQYKGTWNAATNTPAIADGTGVVGDFYFVSVGAARDLGSGSVTFSVNDRVIYNGTIWQAVGGSASVTSVAGKTGTVSLVKADVGLGNVDNTADTAKPVSTAQQTAINTGDNARQLASAILTTLATMPSADATSLATLAADVKTMLDAANNAGIRAAIGAASLPITEADVTGLTAHLTTIDRVPAYPGPPNTIGADRTFVLSDAAKTIDVGSTGARIMTIATETGNVGGFTSVNFPVGTSFEVYRSGAGAVTIQGAQTGMIENPATGTVVNSVTIPVRYGTAAFRKRLSPDVWVASGNIA